MAPGPFFTDSGLAAFQENRTRARRSHSYASRASTASSRCPSACQRSRTSTHCTYYFSALFHAVSVAPSSALLRRSSPFSLAPMQMAAGSTSTSGITDGTQTRRSSCPLTAGSALSIAIIRKGGPVGSFPPRAACQNAGGFGTLLSERGIDFPRWRSGFKIGRSSGLFGLCGLLVAAMPGLTAALGLLDTGRGGRFAGGIGGEGNAWVGLCLRCSCDSPTWNAAAAPSSAVLTIVCQWA